MARESNGSWSDAPQVCLRSSTAFPEVIEQHVGKEVARPEEKEIVEDLAYGLPAQPGEYSAERPYGSDSSPHDVGKRKRRILSLICATIVALVCLGLGLGVGLGLGLKSKNHVSAVAPPTSKPTQASMPSYFSRQGAFNGTGIWAVQQQTLYNLTSGASMPSDRNDGNLIIVFQHHTGQIRWMQRAFPDTWYGGTVYEVVATDAKNATPIAFRGQDVFYVNTDNLLRQKHIDNVTYTWNNGPLNDLNVKVFDSFRVGLAVCFYQGPIENTNLNDTDPESGLRLWVATDETTFDQYAWRAGLPQWVWEETLPDMNGHATPGCFGWGAGWTTYTMFVDADDIPQLYWRDTSFDVFGNATHPMNVWVKSSIKFPKVDPTTGLNFHGNLYGKPADSDQIHGWNITFDAENSVLGSTLLSAVEGDTPLANTQLYSFTTPATGVARQGLIFYQTEGDDISLFTGDVTTGNWTSVQIPIPDD